MKDNILKLGLLIIIFAFVTADSYAVWESDVPEQSGEVKIQTKTDDTGNDGRIQTQNSKEFNGELIQTEAETDLLTRQKIQEGIGSEYNVQNQGEKKEIQTRNQEEMETQNFIEIEKNKSNIANAARELLQVAERNKNVSQQIKDIAQIQIQNQEKLKAGLEVIQSRGGIAKFLIGPNYGEINKSQKILELNREQYEQLNQVKNKLTNQGDAQILTQQIQVLEQTNQQFKNLLQNTQEGFSLFGWMFRFFSK